jgi:hypothetical protein
MSMIFVYASTNLSFYLQVRLAPEDLKMMIDGASGKSSGDVGTVDLKAFIGIMENSAW